MMKDTGNRKHRSILQAIAHQAMLERGLAPIIPKKALTELDSIRDPATRTDASVRDLRALLWCSIDNDDSLDLDQLTVAEALPAGAVKVRAAIADVDAVVRKGSAIDDYARQNTTSVYTPAEIFPMLPVKLSNDLTSLNYKADRLAVVIEMVFTADGLLQASAIYRAMVRNHAKLAYDSVAAWLDGTGPMPQGIKAVDGLVESLRLQDTIAQTLKKNRYVNGSLDFETIQVRPVFTGEELKGLEKDRQNRAKDLIAEVMIAANGVTARYLESRRSPSLQRVVRRPKRWDRIVALAAQHGTKLPRQPDSKALEKFLNEAKAADPVGFPDLSLSIIKLLGSGEYMVRIPGEDGTGHFGLAVRDYNHSTAPNRRYPDLITQRLLKAALAEGASPYDEAELESLAAHCTEQEDDAKKVERQVEKSAAALLLESRIGERFDAIVTGATDHGTWVRIFDPPVEGKLERGYEGVDVGDRLLVRLIGTDVQRGFIDFQRVYDSKNEGSSAYVSRRVSAIRDSGRNKKSRNGRRH